LRSDHLDPYAVDFIDYGYRIKSGTGSDGMTSFRVLQELHWSLLSVPVMECVKSSYQPLTSNFTTHYKCLHHTVIRVDAREREERSFYYFLVINQSYRSKKDPLKNIHLAVDNFLLWS